MKKQDTDISLLATCFHITIDQAANRLGICPTGLKKICRKHGITRWPYRKVMHMYSCRVALKCNAGLEFLSGLVACVLTKGRLDVVEEYGETY